jgi:uncharacterized protein (TIGR02246 family)
MKKPCLLVGRHHTGMLLGTPQKRKKFLFTEVIEIGGRTLQTIKNTNILKKIVDTNNGKIMITFLHLLIHLKQLFMRSKFQLAILLGISVLFLSACSAPTEKTASVDTDKLKPEIQAMEDAFAAAEKAKDADKVAAYYSEDAVSYNRNEEPILGKAAIKERIANRLAKDTTGNYNVYKVVDLFAEGNMAVEIGSWSVLNPSGVEVDKGHYMSYFQKRDGKWVCVRDMNVTSNPAKPM